MTVRAQTVPDDMPHWSPSNKRNFPHKRPYITHTDLPTHLLMISPYTTLGHAGWYKRPGRASAQARLSLDRALLPLNSNSLHNRFPFMQRDFPFPDPQLLPSRRYIKLLVRTVSREEKVVKALPSFTVQNVKEVVARLPERVVLACLFCLLVCVCAGFVLKCDIKLQ